MCNGTIKIKTYVIITWFVFSEIYIYTPINFFINTMTYSNLQYSC